MGVQQRHNAVQNEHVRLFHTFTMNGNLRDLPAVPTVEIIDGGGISISATLTAVKATLGTYYVDFFVPIGLETGQYHDRWTFQFAGEDFARTIVKEFQVNPRDSILNFICADQSIAVTDRMANLIHALESDFIYEAQHIPVYWEQAQRTHNHKKFNLAYGNWLKDPRPLLRLNGELINKGWYADYCGNIYFEKELDRSDVVSVQYQFAYFSRAELVSFINEGLRSLNSIPPATNSYRDVTSTPNFWDYGILLMAAVHALRRLVFGLNFQEKRVIFGEPGASGQDEGYKNAQQLFQSLYNDYNTLWLEISKGIKKELPATSYVIAPEFTLPGGRSRWMRLVFSNPV